MLGTVVAFFETEQHALGLFVFGGGFLKRFDTIPGVRRGEDLDVMKLGHAKKKSPQVGQDCVMNAVFDLVDQENAG